MIPQRVLWAGALTAILAFTDPATAQVIPPAPKTGTDTPTWRAQHGVLLSVVRAGDRLIATGDRGTILLSDDQGASWTVVKSGTSELLTASMFTSPAEGWVVGQDATILHTADNGAHWTAQTTSYGNDQALFSIASLGGDNPQASHLIATGAYNLILESQNGGAAWTPEKIPNLDEDYHLNCVLARGQDVLITGEAGHAFLRHAGTWTPIPVPYDGSQFGCLAGRDGATYSFGLRGSLFVLPANAQAWHRIDTGEQRSLFGGAVLASGLVALVGSNGLVLLFDPATDKLRTMPAPTSVSLSGLAETPDGTWVLVGDDGVHVMDPTAPPPAGRELTQ